MTAKRVQLRLGRNQRLAMGMLADHGVWSPGMPYGIGSDYQTSRVLSSLVARHLARAAWTGERYCLTPAGYAWLIRDAADDLAQCSLGSGAADRVLNRIRQLATCATLAGAYGGPVNWKGERV